MNTSIQAHEVRRGLRQGFPGQVVRSEGANKQRSFLNASPQRVAIKTITINTATLARVYSVTIGGKTVSFTAADTNTTNVAAGLGAAINADPVVRGRVVATMAAAVITLTGLYPGDDFPVTALDAQATLAVTQTSQEAEAIPFGRAILNLGVESGQPELLCALAQSAVLSAQVVTAALTYVASTVIETAIYEVRGSERILLAKRAVTSATDLATVVGAIVTAMNAALPANTVLAAANGGNTAVVYTAEVVGMEFEVEVQHVSGGASSPTITITQTTGPSISTSVHRALAGIAAHVRDEAPLSRTATAGEFAGNSGVLAHTEGEVWVTHDGAVVPGGTVFLELAGSAKGQFYTVGSATRVGLSRQMARWETPGVNNAQDGVASIRISL